MVVRNIRFSTFHHLNYYFNTEIEITSIYNKVSFYYSNSLFIRGYSINPSLIIKLTQNRTISFGNFKDRYTDAMFFWRNLRPKIFKELLLSLFLIPYKIYN